VVHQQAVSVLGAVGLKLWSLLTLMGHAAAAGRRYNIHHSHYNLQQYYSDLGLRSDFSCFGHYNRSCLLTYLLGNCSNQSGLPSNTRFYCDLNKSEFGFAHHYYTGYADAVELVRFNRYKVRRSNNTNCSLQLRVLQLINAFCKPSPSHCTSLWSQHIWPLGVFDRWSDGLELAA